MDVVLGHSTAGQQENAGGARWVDHVLVLVFSLAHGPMKQ